MLRAYAGRYMKVHLVFAMCKQKGMRRLEWVGAAQSLDAAWFA